jgi:prepilin signal peptidase PulO-like enzyme (type II secretory pathway)
MLLGVIMGGGILWLLGEIGKIVFGRCTVRTDATIAMTIDSKGYRTADEGEETWYDLFCRETDTMSVSGRITGLRLRDAELEKPSEETTVVIGEVDSRIGEATVPTEAIEELVIETDHWVLPQEAMGFGDVKMLAVLGVFLGPSGAVFILVTSSLLGTVVGFTIKLFDVLVLKKKYDSTLPYGAYIGAATVAYILYGNELTAWFLRLLISALKLVIPELR